MMELLDDKLPHIPGIPQDTEWLGTKLDSIRDILSLLLNSTTRQEIPAPAVFSLPIAGNNVRLRVTFLVFSVDAAAQVQMRIGAAAQYTFNIASADTRVIPLPITIQEGSDISITASAGNASAFLIGYPDN